MIEARSEHLWKDMHILEPSNRLFLRPHGRSGGRVIRSKVAGGWRLTEARYNWRQTRAQAAQAVWEEGRLPETIGLWEDDLHDS